MCSHLLIDLRVIFHCARAQRIESVVYTEVVATHVGIMAHHCQFVAFGQLCILSPAYLFWHLVVAEMVGRQSISLSSGM